ncbi:NADPH:adrenodoxin oxido, mitochondrial [Cyphellophora attinorum]|uniref:NADPH:adrenodoxin oxidoreductase, mitochondrial n=1 Tax=Cyphellophora attinorum TaxID=1664694 RepID=A0A0N1H3T5_9EURO|nr:NADPH:adrenodoxin oxido, mitochondrial [Phialophora attinorum]KPI36437.1 NADPH:adrenodoxin oxido, mitochondrial [Phialophora attinorum]
MLVSRFRCPSKLRYTRQWGSKGRSLHVPAGAAAHHERGPRIAIVGSGPAGFYTAQKTFREIPGTVIDMYEQLPVPFGLVRYGVAPDHPEVKNVQDTFEELARSPNYTFIGNVKLGQDLPLTLLAKHYDAIVFAYGASKDRKIGLEGEDRPHIYSARAFAGDTAVVVGQGNVALDVARTLLASIEDLKKTDMTDYAIGALAESQIKHVHVVGRRGPLQAAFTIKEVRELLQLPDVNFDPIPADLFPPNTKALERPKRRIMELLQKGSPHKPDATKSWSLDFLLSPESLSFSSASSPPELDGVRFRKTVLSDPESPASGVTFANDYKTLSASTLFRSIGYAAEPIPGMASIGCNFLHGTIQHDGFGRAIPIGTEKQLSTSQTNASVYCAGWVKRGPTGVIASTMTDAFQTAEAIVDDWKRTVISHLPHRAGWQGVKADAMREGQKLDPVHWDQWHKIDAAEKHIGERHGKPREKLGSVTSMLEAARA